jgi:hypothetical protein
MRLQLLLLEFKLPVELGCVVGCTLCFEADELRIQLRNFLPVTGKLPREFLRLVGNEFVKRFLIQPFRVGDVGEDDLAQLLLKFALLARFRLGADLFEICLRNVSDLLDIVDVRFGIEGNHGLRSVLPNGLDLELLGDSAVALTKALLSKK